MTFSQLKSAMYAKRTVKFRASYSVAGATPVHNVEFCIMYRISPFVHYVLLYDTELLVRCNFVMTESFCSSNGYANAVGYDGVDRLETCFSNIELLDKDLTLYDFVET